MHQFMEQLKHHKPQLVLLWSWILVFQNMWKCSIIYGESKAELWRVLCCSVMQCPVAVMVLVSRRSFSKKESRIQTVSQIPHIQMHQFMEQLKHHKPQLVLLWSWILVFQNMWKCSIIYGESKAELWRVLCCSVMQCPVAVMVLVSRRSFSKKESRIQTVSQG